MMLNASGELATSTPTPRATIRMCTTRAACWPRIPQMERRKPELSELLMVLMAPAPGVKLIRTPAPARASQRENCTCQVYGSTTRRPASRRFARRPGSVSAAVVEDHVSLAGLFGRLQFQPGERVAVGEELPPAAGHHGMDDQHQAVEQPGEEQLADQRNTAEDADVTAVALLQLRNEVLQR